MKQLSRKDYSILIANCIDHFDVALYGFLAPIMAPIFFPTNDPLVSLILAYSVYITSLFTRPIGSCIFGLIAIRCSSNYSLIYSLIGVALCSIFIGLIPTYQEIGVFAPLILIILRVLRDIFAAGETAIAKLYIIEEKSTKLALRASHTYQTTAMLGILLASAASTFIIHMQQEYLWRICYISGGVLGFIGLYLRRYNTKSYNPKLKYLFTDSLNNLFHIIMGKKLVIFRISWIYAFAYLTYSTPFILLNSLMPLISDITLAEMMKANTILLIFDLTTLPIVGFLVEKFKAKNIMICAAIVLSLSIIPLWYFLQNANYIYIFCVRGWIVFWGVVFACPFNLWCYEQVEDNQKYIIVGIASSLGAGLLGKMNPAIGLFLYHKFNNYMLIPLYLAGFMLVTTFILVNNNSKS